jgi:hypothetical protein
VGQGRSGRGRSWHQARGTDEIAAKIATATRKSSFAEFFLGAQVPEKQNFGLPAARPAPKKTVLRLHEAKTAPYLCIIKQQPPTGRPC